MENDKQKRGKPWMRILLVVSLGFNLLIAGAVVGSYVTGGPEKRAGVKAPRDNWVGPYGRALSKDDRAEMRKAFEERRAWFTERRQKMRGFGAELAAAVRAEPFDPAAVSAILAEQRGTLTEMQTEGQRLLVERIAAMTPDQRAAFAENLEKGLRRGRRHQ